MLTRENGETDNNDESVMVWRIFKFYALESGDFDDSKMAHITKIEQTYRQ